MQITSNSQFIYPPVSLIEACTITSDQQMAFKDALDENTDHLIFILEYICYNDIQKSSSQ